MLDEADRSFNFRIELTALLNLDLMCIIIFVGRFGSVVTLPVQPLADQVQPDGRLGLRRLKSVCDRHQLGELRR